MIEIISFTYGAESITVGDDSWKEWVLSTDPFEGDIGDGNNLSDKIVKTRNTKQLCSDCLSVCIPGEYSRVITANESGELLTNRYCQTCCTAMAFDDLHSDYKEYNDDDEDYPEEEIMLADIQREKREKNEKILIKALGKRYFEKSDAEKYQVMVEAQEKI